jgi:hypothetical protein
MNLFKNVEVSVKTIQNFFKSTQDFLKNLIEHETLIQSSSGYVSVNEKFSSKSKIIDLNNIQKKEQVKHSIINFHNNFICQEMWKKFKIIEQTFN